jgi:hypothetical protein
VSRVVTEGDGVPDRLTEERIARNDATFREANERIEAVAEENALSEQVPEQLADLEGIESGA